MFLLNRALMMLAKSHTVVIHRITYDPMTSELAAGIVNGLTSKLLIWREPEMVSFSIRVSTLMKVEDLMSYMVAIRARACGAGRLGYFRTLSIVSII